MSGRTDIQFRFVEFNSTRACRGKRAAHVEVEEDGERQLLWMSAHDILENLELFGDSAGLQNALAAYQNGGGGSV